MDQLQAFIMERWLLIIIAVIVLIIVAKLVKTALKWLIILIIAAALVFYGINYTDQLTAIKDAVVESGGANISEAFKEQAAKAIRDEAEEAQYTANADGSFTIVSRSIRLDGYHGAETVTVTIAGQSFEIRTVEAVEIFIEEARGA